MSDERLPIERLLDLAIYAPVGAALALCEHVPKRVRQSRQALENRVQLARFIGMLAVQTGQREIAKRIDEQRVAKQPEAEQTGGPVAETEDAVVTTRVPVDKAVARRRVLTVVPDVAAGDAEMPAAERLPIRDYESLAAINVVERLRSMRPDEIELIRRFEVTHRSRRTILAKIDQLQGR